MRKQLLIPMLAFVLFVGFTTPARATTPIQGSGTLTFSYGTSTVTGTAGGNLFVSVPFTAINTGILTGSCAGSYLLIVHTDGALLLNFIGSETCTGAVDSQAGTYSISFAGTQDVDSHAPFEASFVLGGTDALANLHGQGTIQEKEFGSPFFADYTVTVLFAS